MDIERAISELGITRDFYLELVGDLVVQLKQCIKKLEAALRENDLQEVAAIAHFLKGSAGKLRQERIASIVREMEIAAKERKEKDILPEKLCLLKKALGELTEIAGDPKPRQQEERG